MATLWNIFRDGGIGMWPTLFLGIAALALAIWQALVPARAAQSALVGFSVATLAAGSLGTVLGFCATFRYVQTVAAADVTRIALLGAAESLNCLGLALALCMLVALIGAIAALRGPPAQTRTAIAQTYRG